MTDLLSLALSPLVKDVERNPRAYGLTRAYKPISFASRKTDEYGASTCVRYLLGEHYQQGVGVEVSEDLKAVFERLFVGPPPRGADDNAHAIRVQHIQTTFKQLEVCAGLCLCRCMVMVVLVAAINAYNYAAVPEERLALSF